MRTKRAVFTATVAGALLALVGLRATAEDKKADMPAVSGTWAKKEGQLKIEFVDKELLKFYPHGSNEFIIVCKYSVGKDGAVKSKVTELEGKAEIKEKGKGRFPAGMEINFTFTVKGDSALLDDLKGENTEGLKSHLEGEFTRKSD